MENKFLHLYKTQMQETLCKALHLCLKSLE
jgi:hypothetical protein